MRQSIRICSFADCGRPAHARGLCNGHYIQQRLGQPLRQLQEMHEMCTFPGCNRPHEARGLCTSHYSQWRDGRELSIIGVDPKSVHTDDHAAWASYREHEILVSIEDSHFLYEHHWFLSADGYACTKSCAHRVFLHHLILPIPDGSGLETDHINRNRCDNRRENLRLVTRAQNCQNRSRPNTSGHRNVYFEPKKKLYRVFLSLNGKKILGHRHKRIEDAIAEATSLRKQYFTHSVD